VQYSCGTSKLLVQCSIREKVKTDAVQFGFMPGRYGDRDEIAIYLGNLCTVVV